MRRVAAVTGTTVLLAAVMVGCGGEKACAVSHPHPHVGHHISKHISKMPRPAYRDDGYRSYPGYAGWYAPGIYPAGYAQTYHCKPGPAPTVYVTTTATPTLPSTP